MARTCVFAYDASLLETGLEKFKVSPKRAIEMLHFQAQPEYSGQKYRLTNMIDGWECLQEVAPEDWQPERLVGGYSAAWAMRPSGGYPVWQYIGHK